MAVQATFLNLKRSPTLALMFAFWLASGELKAQVLERKVSLKLTNVTVKEALDVLRRDYGLNITYSSDILSTKRINLELSNVTVKEALDQILKDGNRWRSLGSQIIISQNTGAPPGRADKATLSGYVREAGSAETLPGVTVWIEELGLGTVTNSFGFYSLTIPKGSHRVNFSTTGYNRISQSLDIQVDIVSDQVLSPQVQEVVEIRAEEEIAEAEKVQMSSHLIPMKQIQQIPALLGERDVLKVLQLMPGVKRGNDGSSGFYVRGGGPDQNLILLDDAPVYNANHLFGFFSVFNADALKSVELVKGGFPARYGGRLSSVLDMRMKEGSRDQLHGEVGIGLVSSRFTLEGPLVKDKVSFLVSARRTYIDLLLNPLLPSDLGLNLYFYDINAKVNWEINAKNRVYLSFYGGRDQFAYDSRNAGARTETGLYWGNITGTARFNHVFSPKLFSNTSLIFSEFNFNIFQNYRAADNTFDYAFRSGIRDFTVKQDFDWFATPSHSLRMGGQYTYHVFTPESQKQEGSLALERVIEEENLLAHESALYVEDEIRLGGRARANVGLRASSFTLSDKDYYRTEPRIGFSYLLADAFSFKASYAEMNQYIHLLSNTGIGLPTDLWVPSTRRVRPENSKQLALGAAYDHQPWSTTFSVEGYYKYSDGVIQYRNGAIFQAIDDPNPDNQVPWDVNVTTGEAWSYGVEMLAHRKMGRLSGWIGYTLSWTEWLFPELNGGRRFYARYDRRHDISVVGIYNFSERLSLSCTWVFGSGNPITLPLASYAGIGNVRGAGPGSPGQPSMLEGNPAIRYANDVQELNNFRTPPYHRLDIGLQLKKNTTLFKRPATRMWEFGLYNAYGRRNPFFYYVTSTFRADGTEKRSLRQVSLFTLIPSVNFSLKF